MLWCRICHFATVLDDVVLQQGEQCVCLGCFARQTESVRPMPKELRRVLIRTLAEQPDNGIPQAL